MRHFASFLSFWDLQSADLENFKEKISLQLFFPYYSYAADLPEENPSCYRK